MAGYAVSKRCVVADWFGDDTESGKRKFPSVIEVDGGSHDDKAEYDARRDAFMRKPGLTTIRLRERDVRLRMTDVMDFLRGHPALQSPEGYSMTQKGTCLTDYFRKRKRQFVISTPTYSNILYRKF
jgi:hypothetical protein